MKKLITVLFVIATAFVLVSCKKEPKQETITIMHGAVSEVDPFDDTFTGKDKEEKQRLQTLVEEKYNIKVKYEMFPSDAGWGPARTSKIIETYNDKKPMADIYWTTNSTISTLARAKAITPVDAWYATSGSAIPEAVKTVGTFQEQFYGFTQTKPTGLQGLYFNENLLEKIGMKNPAEIFAEGNWNFTTFQKWMAEAQTKMSTIEGSEEYVLGGTYPDWAQSLIPLNGGSLINSQTKRVAFNQNPANEVYQMLEDWIKAKYFEPNGTGDKGSPEWVGGRVLMHPGSFWFVNAANRWADLGFSLGYVPYPMADGLTKDKYVTPIKGEAVYVIANGIPVEKQELAFKVWNEIQYVKTDLETELEFKVTLQDRLKKDIYVNAFLEIYNGIYLEILDDLGIATFGEKSWRVVLSGALKSEEGADVRTALSEIESQYQNALNLYYEE